MTIPKAPHILVVDDEVKLAKLLRYSLQHAGYTVHTADSGQAALELFDRIPFDVVLTDVKMSGMNGFELCAALRQRNDVLIVLLTAC